MKLVYFFLYINLVICVGGEKVQQGKYSFPLKNPLTNSVIATDNSFYMPSEFQTSNSDFVSNSYDEFPFKLMPSVNAKLSNSFSTPFPILLTPTIDYADDRVQIRRQGNENVKILSPMPFSNNQTRTFTNSKEAKSSNLNSNPQTMNYHPIDRMDTKVSSQFPTFPESTNPQLPSQNSISRKLIISAENGKNQELDQKASFHNVHFAPAPNFFTQSTTEPAIPILRLSNEMDLDGSFSYEALGADQTHYEQHSRMENLGSDKEGQVVEGSYSYVGDNGQTYTVHYIADSNGYRATGEHLPVPPPVPEIIQRSIQYNLAEEAKKPPHLRYFYEDYNDGNPNNSEKNSQNNLSTQRNLFTGRTPEAFSFGFSQGTSSQDNTMQPMISSTDPIKTNIEFTEDKFKRNINYGPLEPQVTFLASQGARLPSTTAQKPAMPQIVNYEPSLKESENTKALWRWQYGLNNNYNDSLNPTKNLISRSSSEGDDVIINFSEMTPAEYSKIIRSHENLPSQEPKTDYSYSYLSKNIENKNDYDENNHKDFQPTLTYVNNPTFNQMDTAYVNLDHSYNVNQSQINNALKSIEIVETSNPNSFVSSTATPRWFDYENMPYEYQRTAFNYIDNNNRDTHSQQFITSTSVALSDKSNDNEDKYTSKVNSNDISLSDITVIPLEYKNRSTYQQKNELRPINSILHGNIKIENKNGQDASTTESTVKEMLKNNIFLKHLITNTHDVPQIKLKQKPNVEVNIKPISKSSRISVDDEPKTYDGTRVIETRPLDVSELFNYMTNKNLFESNKLKTKRKPLHLNSVNEKYEINLDSSYDTIGKENKEEPKSQSNNNFRPLSQQQEIRGTFKNYKVLQRNNVRNSKIEQDNQLKSFHGLQNKNVYSLKLPPLGRAGPSTNSYLPPTYL